MAAPAAGTAGTDGVAGADTVAAAEPFLEIAAPADTAAQERSYSGLKLHYQVGWHFRLNETSYFDYDEDARYMLDFGLNVMKWDRERGAWGLGVRAAIDDTGSRLGPAALWRRPWRVAKGGYVQLTGGWYTTGDKYDYARSWPGWFLSVEAAPNNLIALSLGVESLRVRYYDPASASASLYTDNYRETTDTGLYAGLKLGQGLGAVGTVALFVALAAALSSSNWGS